MCAERGRERHPPAPASIEFMPTHRHSNYSKHLHKPSAPSPSLLTTSSTAQASPAQASYPNPGSDPHWLGSVCPLHNHHIPPSSCIPGQAAHPPRESPGFARLELPVQAGAPSPGWIQHLGPFWCLPGGLRLSQHR